MTFSKGGKIECGYDIDYSFLLMGGGGKTIPGKYPSTALLGRMELTEKKDPSDKSKREKVLQLKFFCGGTLINR